ncbi:hypothetical protein, partial [Actinoplanes siamensis]|uniref:hypothetical protein n=1 Tax=Actinoplanes siamensis TaxID=1223317 RepID=UPI0019430865
LREHSLAQVLQLAWQAVEGARNVIKWNGVRTRTYWATEYGVRRVEHYTTSSNSDVTVTVTVTAAVNDYLTTPPLSAITRTLFGTVPAIDVTTVPTA